jgi:hypothetical protein
MKKPLLHFVLLLFSLVACQKESTTPPEEDAQTVEETEVDLFDVASPANARTPRYRAVFVAENNGQPVFNKFSYRFNMPGKTATSNLRRDFVRATLPGGLPFEVSVLDEAGNVLVQKTIAALTGDTLIRLPVNLPAQTDPKKVNLLLVLFTDDSLSTQTHARIRFAYADAKGRPKQMERTLRSYAARLSLPLGASLSVEPFDKNTRIFYAQTYASPRVESGTIIRLPVIRTGKKAAQSIYLRTTDWQGKALGNVPLVWQWLDCEYDFTQNQQKGSTSPNGVLPLPFEGSSVENPLGSFQAYAVEFIPESYFCQKPQPGDTLRLIASRIPTRVQVVNACGEPLAEAVVLYDEWIARSGGDCRRQQPEAGYRFQLQTDKQGKALVFLPTRQAVYKFQVKGQVSNGGTECFQPTQNQVEVLRLVLDEC